MGNFRKALFWSAVERLGLQGVQFFLTIILARLLSPQEYGLIAMLTIFCSLGYLLVDSGLGVALVQRPNNSADDEATVFYANIGAGVVLTLIICAISPLVAKFYGQPVLIPLLCVLSLQVFLSSLGIVQVALLARAMDFRCSAIITTLSVLSSGLVGIVMAWNGMGVWSLVGQSVSGALFRSLLAWRLGNWRPVGRFRRASFLAMWPFASRLSASWLLQAIFDNNLYYMVIGRAYSPIALGLFNRAWSLVQFPAGFVTWVFAGTTIPAFARLQADAEFLKASVRKVFRMVAVVHFPMMAALAIVADPLVRCLLTDKWAPCVPYLQVLAVAGMLYPLHSLHLNTLTAKGRTDLVLRIEVIKRALTVLTLAISFSFGVSAMVWGILVLSVGCLAVNGYYTRKLLHYRWREQALDLAPIIGATALMAVAMSAILFLKSRSMEAWFLLIYLTNPLTLLLVQMAVGLTIYGLIAGLSRMSTFVELRAEILSYMGHESGKRAEGMI